MSSINGGAHEHLRALAEKNKLKRLEEAKSLSVEDRRKKRLEKGFDRHFAGSTGGGSTGSRRKSSGGGGGGGAPMAPRSARNGRRRSLDQQQQQLGDSATGCGDGENVAGDANARHAGRRRSSLGSKAGAGRRSSGGAPSSLLDISSQVAASKNRKTWGEVVDPVLPTLENSSGGGVGDGAPGDGLCPVDKRKPVTRRPAPAPASATHSEKKEEDDEEVKETASPRETYADDFEPEEEVKETASPVQAAAAVSNKSRRLSAASAASLDDLEVGNGGKIAAAKKGRRARNPPRLRSARDRTSTGSMSPVHGSGAHSARSPRLPLLSPSPPRKTQQPRRESLSDLKGPVCPVAPFDRPLHLNKRDGAGASSASTSESAEQPARSPKLPQWFPADKVQTRSSPLFTAKRKSASKGLAQAPARASEHQQVQQQQVQKQLGGLSLAVSPSISDGSLTLPSISLSSASSLGDGQESFAAQLGAAVPRSGREGRHGAALTKRCYHPTPSNAIELVCRDGDGDDNDNDNDIDSSSSGCSLGEASLLSSEPCTPPGPEADEQPDAAAVGGGPPAAWSRCNNDRPGPGPGSASRPCPRGRMLRLNLLDTWGDIYYMGMTGLAVLTKDEASGEVVEHRLDVERVRASPSDINVNGHFGDPRTLDKLVDGANDTTNERHMWLIEFNPGEDHLLEIDLGHDQFELVGLRVWNYNKAAEDTRRGVRLARVFLDDIPLSPPQGLVFRRATGTDEVPFGQTLLFEATPTPTPTPTAPQAADADALPLDRRWCGGHGFRGMARPADAPDDAATVSFAQQDWQTQLFPTGHTLRIDLLGTHGDAAYVGLDKIEIFDGAGQLVRLDGEGFGSGTLRTCKPPAAAAGSSTNLSGAVSLANGRAWVERLGLSNRLYITFEEEFALSMIKLWNYSKSPQRGASEVAVFMDSLIIFHGELARAEPSSARLPGAKRRPQCILFSDDEDLAKDANVHFCGRAEQTVHFIDNHKVMQPA